MRPTRVLPLVLVVAVAAVVAVGPCASAALAQAPALTADVTTVLVEVPVQVLLPNGEPVRGLSAENFEIFEGRRKQRLLDFELIDLAALGTDASGRTAVPLPARRHFLLLFDLGFSDPSAITRARDAAREVIAHRLHPSDLVGVATYGASSGARLVLGFTSDRRQVDAAIEGLGLRTPVEAVNDPLRLMIVDPSSLQRMLAQIQGREGGANARVEREIAFQEAIRDMGIATGRGQQEIQRGHAVTMVGDFQALGDQLRWVQGRKHVLLLSEGVDSSLLLGTEDAGRLRELSEASASGEFWRIDSDERFGSSASMSVLASMLDAFRRADATVHAIDIGGLRAGPENSGRAKGEDSLFMMAAGTGGELYRNFNDLGQAMERMLERTSVTYVLAFQPEDLPMDGAFHPIRVRLKGGPAGARLVHRPGYFAPVPYRQQSAEARRTAAAELLIGGESGGAIPVGVLAAAVPGAGEEAHVPLLLEIDGPALLAGTGEAKKAILDVYAYALDRDGAVRDFVSQQMALDLERLGPALRQRGIKFRGHLELPAGEYRLRTLVRDVATGRNTVQETRLVVPRFAERQASLLPPLFTDAGSGWLLVKEQPRPGRAEAPDPFALEGRPFLPATRPVVAAGGETELVVMAYHAAAAGRRLEGRVLDRSGAEVAPATLRWVATAAGAPAGVEQIRAVLGALDLRPGEYRLEVRLVDPASGEALVSAIPLLVGS